MYIFNPEHDLCIANGDIHFVPPQSALAFGRDCADIIKFMYGLDRNESNKIMPWGWNSVLCDRLRKQGVSEELLPSRQTLENIVELSHRSVAHQALEYVAHQDMSELDCSSNHAVGLKDGGVAIMSPTYRIAAKSLEEVEAFVAGHNNVVLKAPLSGSGKGIRFVSGALSHSDAGWCSNLIAKHGYVCVEKRYRPLMEFAMLFRCAAAVEFVGYSLFYTQNGAYRGNVLGSNEFIKSEICRLVPEELLEEVKGKLIDFLKENVCGRYEGYVGIDQFVCGEFYGFDESGLAESGPDDRRLWFQPVVEINLRLTMGLIARNIYDRFSREYNLVDGEKCFEICRDKKDGKMVYSYRICEI